MEASVPSNLSRYEARIEHSLYKALRELQHLQAAALMMTLHRLLR